MEINPIYLAGVMDSDGSFSITKRHVSRKNANYTCMVSLTWSCGDIIKEFMDALSKKYGGSHCVVVPSSTKNFPNTKKCYKYCATGIAAEAIINDVLPFLVLKKRQAENILKIRSITSNSHCYPGKERSIEISTVMEELYQNNKKINTKNGINNENTSL